MLGLQSAASCGVYAHFLGGQLNRFLSAADGQWLQLAGSCENWEQTTLGHDPDHPTAVGDETHFDDGMVLQLSEVLGLPQLESTRPIYGST